MWDQKLSIDDSSEYLPRILKVLEHTSVEDRKQEFLQSILDQCEYRKLSRRQIDFFEDLEKEVEKQIDLNVAPAWSESFWPPKEFINKSEIDY